METREKDFVLDVCRRLPLAEAVFRLSQFALDAAFLDQVFQDHRGRSYERVITFPLFVQLVGDALLEHQGSGHQSFVRARDRGDLETSLQAMYDKLKRCPLSLSMGFLAEASARLQQLWPAEVASPVPASLAHFSVLNIDGKKLKHLPKRLKPTRGLRGEVFGGKLVVAVNQATGLTVAFNADLDSETSDNVLVPGLLVPVRRVVSGPRLYVLDRLFCDLTQPGYLEGPDDHFLIRYQRKVSFHADASQPARVGQDPEGRPWREDWGWLGMANDPRRRYVRRIHLPRDKEDVILITSLLDADQYPANDVLEVYRHRWDIEILFQRVTEVFHLNTLIGSTPQATVFQAAFCFVVANLITIIRGYLAQSQKMEPETISHYNLFYEVNRQLVAWNTMLDATTTLQLLSEPKPVEALRDYLH